MSRFLLISNFILFQLGWFACVLGGAYQLPLLGSLIALSIVGIHLWRAEDAKSELKLLSIAILIGLLFESLLVTTHLAQYSSGIIFTGLAPHWMVLMWAIFATTLNVSMRWIKRLANWQVSLLGAVLAPFAYFAGARLDAVLFDNLSLSLGVISLGWATLLPVLVVGARHFNGYAQGDEDKQPLPAASGRSSANV